VKIPHALARREFLRALLKVLVPVFVGLSIAAIYFVPEEAPWFIIGSAITMLLLLWLLAP